MRASDDAVLLQERLFVAGDPAKRLWRPANEAVAPRYDKTTREINAAFYAPAIANKANSRFELGAVFKDGSERMFREEPDEASGLIGTTPTHIYRRIS